MPDDPSIHAIVLTFGYPRAAPVLHDVTFDVRPGECGAVVGPNGAGKTSLFLCLAGVYRRRGGSLRVAGLDPAIREERKQLPTHVGIVFQDSDDQLFNATVLDDVAFGPLNLGLPAEEVRLRVTEVLERAGLAGFEQRVPFHLAGGEERRAARAGGLPTRPPVLLRGEPR